MASAVEIDLAVRNLTGRYCAAVAAFDVDRFAACWTEHAAWVVPNVTTIDGRARIVRVFARLRAPLRYCVQELSSGVVEPNDDGRGASACWQIRESQWQADGSVSCVIGTYRDTVVREAGEWRFAVRRFEVAYRGPVDLSGALTAGDAQTL